MTSGSTNAPQPRSPEASAISRSTTAAASRICWGGGATHSTPCACQAVTWLSTWWVQAARRALAVPALEAWAGGALRPAHGGMRCPRSSRPERPAPSCGDRPLILLVVNTHLDQQVIKLLQHQLPKGCACGRGKEARRHGCAGSAAAARRLAALPRHAARHAVARPAAPAAQLLDAQLCTMPLQPPAVGARTRVRRELVAAMQAARLRHLRRRQAVLRIGAIVGQHLRHTEAKMWGAGQGLPVRKGFRRQPATHLLRRLCKRVLQHAADRAILFSSPQAT